MENGNKHLCIGVYNDVFSLGDQRQHVLKKEGSEEGGRKGRKKGGKKEREGVRDRASSKFGVQLD